MMRAWPIISARTRMACSLLATADICSVASNVVVLVVATGGQDYGGDQGIKGNISEINTIPFAAPPLALAQPGYNPKTQAIGVGYTPEGLDQNPVRLSLSP